VGPIGYPKMMEWNYHFMLRTIPEDDRSKKFSIPVCPSIRRMQNGENIYIYIYIFCDITSENV